MKRLLLVAVLILFLCATICAQDKPKVWDKKFTAVSATLIGSTILDVETTYYSLNKCRTVMLARGEFPQFLGEYCSEGNALMRPFVNSGRPAIYGMQLGIDSGILALAYKWKKRNPELWYFMPLFFLGIHFTAGGFNISMAINVGR